MFIFSASCYLKCMHDVNNLCMYSFTCCMNKLYTHVMTIMLCTLGNSQCNCEQIYSCSLSLVHSGKSLDWNRGMHIIASLVHQALTCYGICTAVFYSYVSYICHHIVLVWHESANGIKSSLISHVLYMAHRTRVFSSPCYQSIFINFIWHLHIRCYLLLKYL